MSDGKVINITTIHDGYNQNGEECKYVVVEEYDKLISINEHKMYELPVEWTGESSQDRCLICDKKITNITDDIVWWTDGSYLSKNSSPFYFTNGGGCMDILIGKDCQKKHGLID